MPQQPVKHEPISPTAKYNESGEEEEDQDMLEEVEKELREFERDLGDLELRHRLGEREDRLDAILTIHPGAGGTESADWAQMLMRMYLRWAERRGFQTQVLDLMPAETAGIRSVTIEMTGSYAYGYLKAEIGVHRLVRKTRQTDATRASHLYSSIRRRRGTSRWRFGRKISAWTPIGRAVPGGST